MYVFDLIDVFSYSEVILPDPSGHALNILQARVDHPGDASGRADSHPSWRTNYHNPYPRLDHLNVSRRCSAFISGSLSVDGSDSMGQYSV